MSSFSDLTPLMRQYHEIKSQYPHTLLFFQVGDFYELFFDDAKQAAAFLGITLTKRGKSNGQPIPLCGVPVHTVDHYLAKLIKGGFRVALCDQLQEPVPGKVVERGVTQVLTPGTLTDSKLLREKAASYLFCFFPDNDQWGLVFAELMTAQLFATTVPAKSHKHIESELIRFFPDEIVLPDTHLAKPFDTYFKQSGYVTSIVPFEDHASATEWALKRCASVSLNIQPVTSALSTFYQYLSATQQTSLEQFKHLTYYKPDDFLLMDRATCANLELVSNVTDGSKKHTLFDVIDGAITPMGSRMIKKWLLRPLVKPEPIAKRLDAIEYFMGNPMRLQELEILLQEMGDIERVIGRIALKRATLIDYISLKKCLGLLPQCNKYLKAAVSVDYLGSLYEVFISFERLYALLDCALNEDTSRAWIIKNSFDQTLDDMRELLEHGTQKIMALEAHEQQASGISSLKIRYNSIHGYYIEVSKTHTASVPDYYVRQQTLVGKERYTTAQLDQLQQNITRASNEVNVLEKEIFERVKAEVAAYLNPLRKVSYALASLDAIVGLARVSYDNGYVRPTFNESGAITIRKGRHPVVEKLLGHSYIANDTVLDASASTWIITGPNMGGKSTYLRQVALITIMAQLGMFVPAQAAQLALVDRIYTRIGAGDNVALGKSTFLVEMEETATICTTATAKSLVILDEVGRGTSTFDGMAIAQAVVEYIHSAIQAKCLFATHYHELTRLEQLIPGIVNYHAASQKTGTGIRFLYKIQAGAAQGSFGLEVARLAHVPVPIIERAAAILEQLETNTLGHSNGAQNIQTAPVAILPATLERKLQLLDTIDYDNLSPKQAFDLLWQWKELS